MLKKQRQKKLMKYKLRKKKNKEITGYHGYWDGKKKKRVFETLWQEKK